MQSREQLQPGAGYLETPIPTANSKADPHPSPNSNRDRSPTQSRNGDKPLPVMLRPQSYRLLHDPPRRRHSFRFVLRRRRAHLGPRAAPRWAPLCISHRHYCTVPFSGNSQLFQ